MYCEGIFGHRNIIYNATPIYMADKLSVIKEFPLHFIFTDESAVEAEQVIYAYKNGLTPDEVAELLKTPVGGLLPDEHEIYRGDLSEIHPAFRVLANNLLTGRKRLYDVTKKYSGVVGNIRRILKRKL